MPGGGSKLANKVKKRIHVAPSAVHVIMEAWRMDGGVADVSVRA